MDERTYTRQVRPAETLTALDDGGTVHRQNGADPYHGVEVATYSYTEEFDDDVPFALPPDPHLDTLGEPVEPGDTPFDVAGRIVVRFGVDYARQVAEEITRWGECQ